MRKNLRLEVRNRMWCLVILSLCLFISATIFAQKKEKKKYRIVKIEAKHIKYNNKTKDLWTNKGMILKSEDVTIVAKEFLYNTEKETIKASGDLKLTQKGTEITADKLSGNLKDKIIILQNNVKMIQEKKEIRRETTLKEHMKDIVTIFCDKIEYDYGKKEGKASGNIRVVQEDGFATGDRALYSDKEQIIKVIGNVKIERKDGSKLSCDRAVISLKDDWIEAEGDIKGVFKVEEEKVPETKF